MIHVHEVSKSYGGLNVLDGVNLTIRRGELTVLLGPNGAGKSTLMKCLMGITSFEGKIRVDGIDPLRDGRSVRRMIGFMPQSGSLHCDLNVLETLAFYASFRHVATDPLEQLREVDLEEQADKRVSELSGGMQQRLSFAIARLGHPPVLILDEPTASLDRESKRIMLARLRQLADEGVTILLSTHIDSDVSRIADRFVMLEDGRIVEQRINAA